MKSLLNEFKEEVKLKPCPFCGHDPYISKYEVTYYDEEHPVYQCKLVCPNCFTEFKINPKLHNLHPSSIWNRRVND